MKISVSHDETKNYPNLGTYRIVEITAGKTTVTISDAMKSSVPHIQVIVNNASHRAWRRMGRSFPNLEEAVAHYKSAEVKSALSYLFPFQVA